MEFNDVLNLIKRIISKDPEFERGTVIKTENEKYWVQMRLSGSIVIASKKEGISFNIDYIEKDKSETGHAAIRVGFSPDYIRDLKEQHIFVRKAEEIIDQVSQEVEDLGVYWN